MLMMNLDPQSACVGLGLQIFDNWNHLGLSISSFTCSAERWLFWTFSVSWYPNCFHPAATCMHSRKTCIPPLICKLKLFERKFKVSQASFFQREAHSLLGSLADTV